MIKILVIDDDPAMQDAFRLIFERAQYNVIVFTCASSLLTGSAEVPDIYILDKQLPGVDGLDVCRFLKADPRTAHVPVIMVSASPHIARLAKEACADDFLEKPFRRRELLDLVQQLISERET